MLHHPHDAYDKFEEISGLVKYTNFKIRDPEADHEVNLKAGVITNKEALELIRKAYNLINEVPDLVKPKDRARLPTSPNQNCVIPNFPEQADMLEWASISFGEQTNQLIQKSLKRLARISGATYVNLFGKILCTGKDYWVAQGQLKDAEEMPA